MRKTGEIKRNKHLKFEIICQQVTLKLKRFANGVEHDSKHKNKYKVLLSQVCKFSLQKKRKREKH